MFHGSSADVGDRHLERNYRIGPAAVWPPERTTGIRRPSAPHVHQSHVAGTAMFVRRMVPQVGGHIRLHPAAEATANKESPAPQTPRPGEIVASDHQPRAHPRWSVAARRARRPRSRRNVPPGQRTDPADTDISRRLRRVGTASTSRPSTSASASETLGWPRSALVCAVKMAPPCGSTRESDFLWGTRGHGVNAPQQQWMVRQEQPPLPNRIDDGGSCVDRDGHQSTTSSGSPQTSPTESQLWAGAAGRRRQDPDDIAQNNTHRRTSAIASTRTGHSGRTETRR